jgi:hypothetical protein
MRIRTKSSHLTNVFRHAPLVRYATPVDETGFNLRRAFRRIGLLTDAISGRTQLASDDATSARRVAGLPKLLKAGTRPVGFDFEMFKAKNRIVADGQPSQSESGAQSGVSTR